jgi:hypothetical protein
VASKAKRKQRRRREPAAAGAPAAAATTEAQETAKPPKRLERRVAQSRAHDPGKPRPHRLDVRAGVARPQPIWAPFPLTEIALFIGVVLFGVGFVLGSGRGAAMIGAGAFILTVTVTEMCLREHLAGFKSHTLLLAFLPVVVLHSLIYFVISDDWRGPAPVFVDLSVFAVLALLLHQKYRAAHQGARTVR